MESFYKILSRFQVQDSLNPQIWNLSDDTMNPKIRQSLLAIADEFINYLGFDIFVQDITMTGSLANYNWSKFSDIDLHIMFDFNEAKNQKEFIDTVLNETGVKVEVVDGKEEAKLIFRGIQKALEINDKKVLCIDIGGGSTEFIHAENGKIKYAESITK